MPQSQAAHNEKPHRENKISEIIGTIAFLLVSLGCWTAIIRNFIRANTFVDYPLNSMHLGENSASFEWPYKSARLKLSLVTPSKVTAEEQRRIRDWSHWKSVGPLDGQVYELNDSDSDEVALFSMPLYHEQKEIKFTIVATRDTLPILGLAKLRLREDRSIYERTLWIAWILGICSALWPLAWLRKRLMKRIKAAPGSTVEEASASPLN